MPDPQAAPANQKVSQATIDSIKKMGMSAALKQYNSGNNSPEFKTAMERYYSPQRLKASSGQASNAAAASKATGDTGNITATAAKPKSIPMPASAPAAATRRVAPAPTVGKPSTLGTATSGTRAGADKILSKIGGGPTASIGGRNAGTETANAVKSLFGGIKSLYRKQTNTTQGAKPKNG
jgi:hypothetical protein